MSERSVRGTRSAVSSRLGHAKFVLRMALLTSKCAPVHRVCGSDFDVSHLSRVIARPLVPRAAVLARTLQSLEVAAIRRERARPPRSTGSRSRAPISASRGGRPSRRVRARPPVPGKFSARNAFNASRSPSSPLRRRGDARRQSRPRRRRHLSVLTYPRSAASSSSNSSIFRPVASTASRMPLLTARSTARSAGSGRWFSTRDTATSKGRPGKATPACASRSRVRLRARLDAARRIGDHRGWCRASSRVPRARSCACRARI